MSAASAIVWTHESPVTLLTTFCISVWIYYWSYVQILGKFKINLECIITSMYDMLTIICKQFPKSITGSDDNILMHVWLSKQFDQPNFLDPYYFG
jgi:hypothetical protein